MKRILLPLLLLVPLSACETLGLSEDPVAIEDRNAQSGTAQQQAKTAAKKPATAATTGSGASATSTETGGVNAHGVETSGLSGDAAMTTAMAEKSLDGANGNAAGNGSNGGASTPDIRKDPASPLSKRSIFFDYDSFEVKDDYRSMIEAHANYLNAHHDAHIIIQGNTDARGSREYNLALGQKRAEAVRKSLMALGVSDEQLEAISFGEEKPRSVGTTEEDYAENRRADIVYSDE